MKRPLCMVCVGLMLLAGVWYALSGKNEPVFPAEEGELAYLVGTVCEKDADNIYLSDISGVSFTPLSGQTLPAQTDSDEQNFKLKCQVGEPLFLGERVCVKGTFQPFSSATNPGQFDAFNYYAAKNTVGSLRGVTLLWRNYEKWFVREGLWQIKQALCRRIDAVFEGSGMGVMRAVLLGDRGQVDRELRGLYQRNGIVHILSISGLHISLLGLGLYELLRKLGLGIGKSAAAGAVLMVLYGVMTSAGVSAVRAIGMYLIRMLSFLWGRTYDALTALALMGCITVLWQPSCLQNSGFYLSYMAVLGILLLQPPLLATLENWRKERKGNWADIRFWAGKGLLPGLSVLCMTLPVQLWFLYEIPVFGLLLNLVVVPAMSVLFVSGALALLPGFAWLGFAAKTVLRLYEALCWLSEGLPAHMWRAGKPALWQIGAYYLLLFLFLWLRKEELLQAKRQKRAAAAAFVTSLFFLMNMPKPLQGEIVFLDVGQGSCCLIQTNNGEHYLFDCGSTSVSAPGAQRLVPYLNYCGIRTLDKVFLSHADTDHMNGLEELFELAPGEDIRIDEIVLPYGYQAAEGLLGAIAEYREKRALKITMAYEGDTFVSNGIRLLCLSPARQLSYTEAAGESQNEISQCFYIELLQKNETRIRVLLTGDIQNEGEEELIRALQRRGIDYADVLQVAHHGSRYATSQALLDTVSGKIAVISCARKNSYGHPNPQVVERLLQAGFEVHMTMDDGAVRIRETGGGLTAAPYR